MSASMTKNAEEGHAGALKFTCGNFTTDTTTQEITTELTVCLGCVVQHIDSAVITAAPAFNETFPVNGGVLTLINVSSKSGIWLAWGY